MKYNRNNDNHSSQRAEEFDLPERKRPVKRPSAPASREAGTRQASSSGRPASSSQNRKYSNMSQQHSHSGQGSGQRPVRNSEQRPVRTSSQRSSRAAASRTPELSKEMFLSSDYNLNDELSGTGSSSMDRLFGDESSQRRQRSSEDYGKARTAQRRSSASDNQARTARRRPASDEQPRTARRSSSDAQSRSSGRRSSESVQTRRAAHTGKSSGNGRKNKKTLKKDIFAIILLALQAALSIALIIVLTILNVLPAGLFILLVVVLIVLWLLVFFSQWKRYKKLPLIGKIFSIIICIVLIVGNYYMIITNKAIDTVSEEVAYDIDYIDVVVMANDPAQKIEDAADYTFGTQATFQPINLNTALSDIEDAIGKEPKTKDYTSALNQADALYSGEVKAIIYNRDFKTAIEEKHEKYEEETRVIMTITIKEQVDIKAGSDVDVTTQPFLFYISGNDEYGDISISGRSDVNMLVAVNPVSRQVLMINTPRDYYVELPGVSGGMRDKLTHAGVYGVQCQVDTMSALYGYDVDYYSKVNFSSLWDIVDCLGGIDIYNDYYFHCTTGDSEFEEGNIHLDGFHALEYCRERESLEDGDFERGRHQQIVLEAIINKLLSSAGFTAYSQLIKTLEKCCITNIPKESISALVKKQLAEGGGWNIVKASAEGGGLIQATYSMGEMGLYVCMPYAQSIRNVQEMLRALYAGEEVIPLQMAEEGDDYTFIAEPGPVPEIADEEEETTTAAPEPAPVDDGGGDDGGGDNTGGGGDDTGGGGDDTGGGGDNTSGGGDDGDGDNTGGDEG